MARPSKVRRVCHDPGDFYITTEKGLSAKGLSAKENEDTIVMTVDEYEAIRLIDYENISQEECAVRMNIDRTTAQAIYNSARLKLAKFLIDGMNLHIVGGNFDLCDGSAGCSKCGQK